MSSKTTSQPRLPNREQRTAVIGSTGTGKTVASVWLLSQYDIDVHPWVIIDYKTDRLINSIDRAQYVPIGYVPKKPGVYIVQPIPEVDDDVMDAYLWELWKRENIGIYVDEGTMVTGMGGFNACLTQGRSKQIPMIVCTQRPVSVSRWLFSEASFYMLFPLTDERDRKTVSSFVPVNLDTMLPDYNSYYYDVGQREVFRFKPVPDEATILDTINDKLKKKVQYI